MFENALGILWLQIMQNKEQKTYVRQLGVFIKILKVCVERDRCRKDEDEGDHQIAQKTAHDDCMHT